MECQPSCPIIDEYVRRLVRTKARQLIGKAGYRPDDREDIEQDMMLDIVHRMQHFDATKAQKNTFITRIVEHKVPTLLEARNAQCRNWRLTVSLNKQIVHADECGEWLDLVSTARTVSRHETEPIECRMDDLRVDVERTIVGLSPELQDICQRLTGSTITEIARDTGMPRGTLYERIARIRQRFQECGMDEYLDGRQNEQDGGM